MTLTGCEKAAKALDSWMEQPNKSRKKNLFVKGNLAGNMMMMKMKALTDIYVENQS